MTMSEETIETVETVEVAGKGWYKLSAATARPEWRTDE